MFLKNILSTVFHQLWNITNRIYSADYSERSESRHSQRMAIMKRELYDLVWVPRIKRARTRDVTFPPTVFARYQGNEKALLASNAWMYVFGYRFDK